MKTSLRILFLSLMTYVMTFGQLSFAQNLPPRYATLEHFTNTPCPACGSQNPGFFNLLSNYEGEYHQISYYPGQPYSSCIFYQANTTENEARTDYYNIFSSPRVVINGLDQSSAAGVSASDMNAVTGGESPLEVRVIENSGMNRTVDVDINVFETPSVTNAKLYAAVVEKEIMYNAPNGENIHHNVFRKFLSSSEGNDIDISQSQTGITFDYTIDGTWNEQEIYTIVWIQDPVSKEVMNSGTQFDPPFLSAIPEIATQGVRVFPNPVKDFLEIDSGPELEIARIQIHNSIGQLIKTSTEVNSSISVEAMNSGIYFLTIESNEGQYLQTKFVKY